jgi:amino acid adenylation domain-containing protein
MIDPQKNVLWQLDQVVRDRANDLAIAGGDWEPTYRELDDVANHLAFDILNRPLKKGTASEPTPLLIRKNDPNEVPVPLFQHGQRDNNSAEQPFIPSRVALIMSHDAPLIAAMMAVLKAGRMIVVLNPHEPAERLELILHSVQPSLIITDSAGAALAQKIAQDTPTLIFSRDGATSRSAPLPQSNAKWNDIACLIHTSGSTGRPKGVMRTHGQIIDSARRSWNAMPDYRGRRVIALASLSMGQGQSTAWTTLLRGGILCPFAATDRGVIGLEDFINRQKVDVITLSASLFRCFVKTLGERRLDHPRLVRLTSEPPTMAEFRAFKRHFHSDCQLTNTISSSETGSIAQWHYHPGHPASDPEFEQGPLPDTDRLPIGTAVSGIELHLVDEHGNDVADDEPGELVVRSRYFAAGYWNDPETTDRHFTFDAKTQLTTFRGGDVLRRRPDGTLVFAGRRDARLKIRGYRIEPSDVELALQAQPGIESAVVGAAIGPASSPLLVAYFTANAAFDNDLHSLRAKLRLRLPDYMLPARLIRVDALPMTASGKINRHELFSRSLPGPETISHEELPQTDTERQLAAIWQRVFHRDHIGRLDHFFELGGDSLMAAVIAAHLHAESKIEIPLRHFGDHPRLCDLATAMDQQKPTAQNNSHDANAPTLPRNQPLPLSFAQEWIWRECTNASGNDGWTTVKRHRLTGQLHVDLFRTCLQHVFERHEILRTTFTLQGKQPMANVHPSAELALSILDFSHEDDPHQTANSFVIDQMRHAPFDLRRLPLLKFWLIRTSDDEHVLFRAIHHIIVDAWSWKVFFNELAQLYQNRLQGESVPIPAAPQYVEYAASQRANMDPQSARYQNTLNWWKKRFHRHPRRLRLPFERSRICSTASAQEGVVESPIEPEVSERLNRIAADHRATRFSIRFAVLAAAIAEATGQNDLIVGTYTTGRTRLETQNMFGMFANLMTLRLKWDPTITFIQWLNTVTEAIAEARENAELPYQLLCQLLKERGCTWPAIHTIIAATDRGVPESFGGLRLSAPERLVERMPWGFSLNVVQNAEDRWSAEFDAHRFDPKIVHSFINRCQELFDILSCQPDQPLSQVIRRHQQPISKLFHAWDSYRHALPITQFARRAARRFQRLLVDTLPQTRVSSS